MSRGPKHKHSSSLLITILGSYVTFCVLLYKSGVGIRAIVFAFLCFVTDSYFTSLLVCLQVCKTTCIQPIYSVYVCAYACLCITCIQISTNSSYLAYRVWSKWLCLICLLIFKIFVNLSASCDPLPFLSSLPVLHNLLDSLCCVLIPHVKRKKTPYSLFFFCLEFCERKAYRTLEGREREREKFSSAVCTLFNSSKSPDGKHSNCNMFTGSSKKKKKTIKWSYDLSMITAVLNFNSLYHLVTLFIK